MDELVSAMNNPDIEGITRFISKNHDAVTLRNERSCKEECEAAVRERMRRMKLEFEAKAQQVLTETEAMRKQTHVESIAAESPTKERDRVDNHRPTEFTPGVRITAPCSTGLVVGTITKVRDDGDLELQFAYDTNLKLIQA